MSRKETWKVTPTKVLEVYRIVPSPAEDAEPTWERNVEIAATAFTNTVRAAVLLFFPRNTSEILSKTAYFEKFQRVFAGTKFADLNRSGAFAYTHPLTRLGLLAPVMSKNPNTGNEFHTGWALTKKGRKLQTIAAFFIDFEEKEGLSLRSILGGIGGNTKDADRAPSTRMNILLELETGEKSNAQLRGKIAVTERTIRRSLQALSQTELIDYTAANVRAHQNLPRFKVISPTVLPPDRTSNTNNLFEKVAAAIAYLHSQSNSFSVDDIINYLRDKFPEDFTDQTHFPRYRKTVSAHLGRLKRKGAIVREKQDIGPYYFSFSKLTPKGENFLTEFIHPLIDALKDDEKFAQMQNSINFFSVRDNLENMGAGIGKRCEPYSHF